MSAALRRTMRTAQYVGHDPRRISDNAANGV